MRLASANIGHAGSLEEFFSESEGGGVLPVERQVGQNLGDLFPAPGFLNRLVFKHPPQPLASLSQFFLLRSLLSHLRQGIGDFLLGNGKKAVVLHFEIELVLEQGSHQTGDVIIGDLFAEAQMSQIGVVIGLRIILHEFPERLNLDLLLQPVSLLFRLLQPAQELFPGAMHV